MGLLPLENAKQAILATLLEVDPDCLNIYPAKKYLCLFYPFIYTMIHMLSNSHRVILRHDGARVKIICFQSSLTHTRTQTQPCDAWTHRLLAEIRDSLSWQKSFGTTQSCRPRFTASHFVCLVHANTTTHSSTCSVHKQQQAAGIYSRHPIFHPTTMISVPVKKLHVCLSECVCMCVCARWIRSKHK